ncbi:hypothetical protein [Corallococcus sp. 4LFB]|uniref:hypothetical protein n=1 Tax=Corallococcus sp. 4LFB TaxID=3383249 RepID=UPI003974B038
MNGGDPVVGPREGALRITLAGWTVVLEVEEAALASPLQRVFGAFLAPEAVAAEARLVMRTPSSPGAPPAVQELPRLEPGDSGTLRVEGAGYSAVLSPDRSRADVIGWGRYPVENLIKVMLASALASAAGC